jgi:hypothetical protein
MHSLVLPFRSPHDRLLGSRADPLMRQKLELLVGDPVHLRSPSVRLSPLRRSSRLVSMPSGRSTRGFLLGGHSGTRCQMRDVDKTKLEFLLLAILMVPWAAYYLMQALAVVLGG